MGAEEVQDEDPDCCDRDPCPQPCECALCPAESLPGEGEVSETEEERCCRDEVEEIAEVQYTPCDILEMADQGEASEGSSNGRVQPDGVDIEQHKYMTDNTRTGLREGRILTKCEYRRL